MRKQDRVANLKQSRQDQPERKDSRPEQTDREQIKGSAAEPQRPPRQPGKLPLPD